MRKFDEYEIRARQALYNNITRVATLLSTGNRHRLRLDTPTVVEASSRSVIVKPKDLGSSQLRLVARVGCVGGSDERETDADSR